MTKKHDKIHELAILTKTSMNLLRSILDENPSNTNTVEVPKDKKFAVCGRIIEKKNEIIKNDTNRKLAGLLLELEDSQGKFEVVVVKDFSNQSLIWKKGQPCFLDELVLKRSESTGTVRLCSTSKTSFRRIKEEDFIKFFTGSRHSAKSSVAGKMEEEKSAQKYEEEEDKMIDESEKANVPSSTHEEDHPSPFEWILSRYCFNNGTIYLETLNRIPAMQASFRGVVVQIKEKDLATKVGFLAINLS